MARKYKLFNYILLVVLSFLIVSCSSDVQETACTSQEDFNPVFRQCVPKALGTSIQIQNSAPSLPYEVSITSTSPVTHSLQISDPYAQGYFTYWYLGVTLVASNTDTYNIIPNTLPAGVHILKAIVKDQTQLRVLGERTWSFSVTALAVPTISATLPSIPSVSFTTISSPSNFSVTINNPDTVSGYNLQYFLDGNIVSFNSVSPVASTNISYTFNPGGVYALGSHVLQAFLRNAVGDQIAVHTWTVILTNPAYPSISATQVPTTPGPAATITVIDGVNLAAGGFMNNVGTPVQFCLQTNDFDGTQNNSLPGTNIQYFLSNSPIGVETPIATPVSLTASNTDFCLSNSLPAGPAYQLDLANPQIGESKVIIAALYDNFTGVRVDSRFWVVSIRPKNTPPVISANAPSNASPVTVAQDTVNNFLFNTVDIDSLLPDEFETEFFLNGTSQDGSGLTSSCFHLRLSGQPAAQKFSCDLNIRSFSNTGPVPPSTNSLTAVTRDTAVAAWGGANLESNVLSWSVITTEAQTAPVIAAPIYGDGAGTPVAPGFPPTGAASSFVHDTADVALNPKGLAGSGSILEGDNITFRIAVTDLERDHLQYSFARCATAAGVTCVNIFLNQPFTKNNGNENSFFFFTHTVSQEALIGAATGPVYYKVTVNDVPDTVASLSHEMVFTLDVTNVNPPPVLVGPSNPPASPALTVVTGMPLSLDPGVITDASIIDGEILEYQWGISTNALGPFTDITGATNKILTWTPPSDIAGTNRFLRLCIGDNGFGNEVATCAVNTSWEVIPVSNLVMHAGSSLLTSSGEVSTWFDAPNNTLYTAYSAGSYPSAAINLTKTIYNSNGTTTQSTLEFPTEDSFVSSSSQYDISDLSLTGSSTLNSLYISYLIHEPVGASGFYKRLRIRRVDITDDNNLGFAYSGLIFNDSGTCFAHVRTGSVTTITLIPPTVPTPVTCTYGHGIEINGLYFELSSTLSGHIGNVYYVNPISLDPNDIASQLVIDINAQSGDERLTTLSNPPVAIGTTPNENEIYIDHSNLYRDSYNDTRLVDEHSGKIFTYDLGSGLVWSVPFIDFVTGGKIGFINSAPILSATSLGATTLPNATFTETTTSESYQEIYNSYSQSLNREIIATRTNSNKVNLYSFTPGAFSTPTSTLSDVFSSYDIQNIKVAGGKPSNQYVYLTGLNMAATGLPLSLAKIPELNLNVCGTGCEVESPLMSNIALPDYGTNISKYEILSSTQNEEAFISIISGHNSKAYIGKITGSTTPVMELNLAPILRASQNAYTASADFKISVTPLLHGLVDTLGIVLGDTGSVAGQNSRNGFFLTYFKTSSLVNPETAFINVKKETTMSPTANDPVNGFMLPYVK